MKRVFLFCLAVISLFACSSPQKTAAPNEENIFKYAQNLYSRQGSDTVVVYFPWTDGRDSMVYCLNEIRKNLPEQNTSIAALSTTDIAMLSELGLVDNISGVCDYFRISNETVRKRYDDGHIQNVGTSMEVNIEALLALNPDITITSAFNRADIQKYQHVQCPVVFTTSWQEVSPLARVEWIRFLGMILGVQDKADSVFFSIEKKYNAMKTLTDTIANKPVVLAGAASNDIWYMPGGASYIATFIADAGGNFIGKNNTNTGSVVLNFEQVLQLSANADVWIGCDEKSYEDLDAINKNYKLLSVYQKRTIYNRSKRCNANGGNDYWEYGYVRPDIVLADYIKIIHPELLPNYETVFLDSLK